MNELPPKSSNRNCLRPVEDRRLPARGESFDLFFLRDPAIFEDHLGGKTVLVNISADRGKVCGIHTGATEPQFDGGLYVTHGLHQKPLSFVEFELDK